MSLAGLAIAIGDVGDMGIIMTENIYRHVATGDKSKSHFQTSTRARPRSAGAIITAVSNTLVRSSRCSSSATRRAKMFRPLAFTKTFAIGGSVVLAITVVPLLCYFLFYPVKWNKRVAWDSWPECSARERICDARRAAVDDEDGSLQRMADVLRRRCHRRAGRRAHDARTLPADGRERRLAARLPRL
jgi:multidrug efflux pump subunit AcrB